MKNEEDPCIHVENREMNSNRDIYPIVFLSILFLLLPSYLYAWTGYDHDTENYIECDQDISVIQGKDVDIYDYSDESRHKVQVISVDTDGDVAEIKVYDYNVDEYRTFEMDMETDDQHKNEENKEGVLTWRVVIYVSVPGPTWQEPA